MYVIGENFSINLAEEEKKIKEKYNNLRKSDKGKFLAYLQGHWGMVPTTVIAKIKGRNKFRPLEIMAIAQSIKEAEYLFKDNNN